MIELVLLVVFALALFTFGFWKSDHWLIVLGSFTIVSIGLMIFQGGLGNITDYIYRYTYGVIFMATGFYLGLRAILEALKGGI
jgi:hypothetical protein